MSRQTGPYGIQADIGHRSKQMGLGTDQNRSELAPDALREHSARCKLKKDEAMDRECYTRGPNAPVNWVATESL
jgi:hypothetical protein